MDDLSCPNCKKKMVIVFDTPLCNDCDNVVIYDLNVFIKEDIKEVNKNGRDIVM